MNQHNQKNSKVSTASALTAALMLSGSLEASSAHDVFNSLTSSTARVIATDKTLRFANFQDPAADQEKKDPAKERIIALLTEYEKSFMQFIDEVLILSQEYNPTRLYATQSTERLSLSKQIEIIQPGSRTSPLLSSQKLSAARSFMGNVSQSSEAKNQLSLKVLDAIPEDLALLLAEGKAQVQVIVSVLPFGRDQEYARQEPFQFNLFSRVGNQIKDISCEKSRPDPAEFLPAGIPGGYDEFRRIFGKPSIECLVKVTCDSQLHEGTLTISSSSEVELLQEIERKTYFARSPGSNRSQQLDSPNCFTRILKLPQPSGSQHPLANIVSSGEYKINFGNFHSQQQLKEWTKLLKQGKTRISPESIDRIVKDINTANMNVGKSYRQAESSAQRLETYLLNRLGDNYAALSRILYPEELGNGSAQLPRPFEIISQLRGDMAQGNNINWLEEAKKSHKERMASLRARCQRL